MNTSIIARTVRTCQESLRFLGERFGRFPPGLASIGRSDFVDRLFGELTHFSYVVELGAKSPNERKNS